MHYIWRWACGATWITHRASDPRITGSNPVMPVKAFLGNFMPNAASNKIMNEQHFLDDKRILGLIVQKANLNKNDIVLEIGGGTGTISSELAKRCGSLIIVEKDQELSSRLSAKFNGKQNVSVLHGDILEISLPKFNKIVSNIPYSVIQQFFVRLIDERKQNFDQAVLIVPYVFERKMTASLDSKYFGYLSALFFAFYDIEMFIEIDKKSFSPPPKVTSRAVSIKPIPKHPSESPKTRLILQSLLLHNKRRVKNVIFQSLWNDGEFITGKKLTRREAKSITGKIVTGINLRTMEKEVSGLTNTDYKAIISRLIAWEKIC